MDKPISVVIVDDHQVVLDGFIARLELEPDIDVIGTASNGLEAIEVVKHLRPDVVLMDISMPIMNGIEATGVIKEELPESKILMLTMHDNREPRFNLFLRVRNSDALYARNQTRPSQTQSA
ncbi:response regulator transcription factor [Vibrio parahaemolyticus]|nr:response regulator transcription factor [Vibrio parahaemolyticus]